MLHTCSLTSISCSGHVRTRESLEKRFKSVERKEGGEERQRERTYITMYSTGLGIFLENGEKLAATRD